MLTELLTGERNILRCDLMEDTGASINPEVDVGQIEGSFVFALGWWLQVRDSLIFVSIFDHECRCDPCS